MSENLGPDSIKASQVNPGIPINSASLAEWFAEPLTRESADARLELINAGGAHTHPDGLLLERLRLRFWSGKPIDADLRLLTESNRPALTQALAELVVGQLHMSRRMNTAQQHLLQGFQLAVALFRPRDYLTVMQRHESLARLPLFTEPRPAQTLNELLAEAALIERLAGCTTINRRYSSDHTDTMD